MIKFKIVFQTIFLLTYIFSKHSIAQDRSDNLPQEAPNASITSQIKKGVQSTIEKIFPKKEGGGQSNKSQKNNSLIYGKEELQKIKNAVEAFKNQVPLVSEPQIGVVAEIKDPVKDDSTSYVYLGSILYKSNREWSVWINDKKISSLNNYANNDIYVTSINKNKVEIIWTMTLSKWKILTNSGSEEGAPMNDKNQVEYNFILSFNQSYLLNENKVIEGRVGSSLSIE
ncbi:MAG: hypothetical protein ACJA0S_000777 [Rickettsiales bacterium]